MSSGGRLRRRTLVLLISRDQILRKRIAHLVPELAAGLLTIETVDRVSDATQRIKDDDGVDAVLMDWDLPATWGFETLLMLMSSAPDLPIIILGDDSDPLQQMSLVEHGAQDYLLKRRVDADTLIGMVHSAIARKSREQILFSDKDRAQVTLKAMAQKMTQLAQHDVLTSLPNRGLLDDRLAQGLALAKRHGRRLAVLYIDLDYFKHINDSLGHLIGDQLLQAVALRIGPCVRSSDTVGRQGGDEFIVLLSEIGDAEDAALIADKIRLAVLEPYPVGDHVVQLTASIGVSVCPEDGANSEGLIQFADTAMRHAKEQGRNRHQFFKEAMNIRAAERQMIRSDLRGALDRREFLLEYQPKVNLASGGISGVEALIRWRHPTRGILHPLEFIQIAEDCGLIVDIGQWVLKKACVQAQTWVTNGIRFGTVAVNISAVEFDNEGFLENVRGILKTAGLRPSYLEMELTETAVMRNFDATSGVLQALSAMGIRIALDDFGTGYSNLTYLERFPIDTLKLDKSFVHDVPGNANMATIVRSVISMGQSLHLTVVAEGVENAEQLQFLQAYGCAEGQGYHFSRSVDPTACEALISVGGPRWSRQGSPATLHGSR